MPAYHSRMTAEAVAADQPRYLDRELSWLEFNARVLALSENATRPLLERAKFLAIFSSNLDEFFQVRVSGLKDQLEAGIRPTSVGRLLARALDRWGRECSCAAPAGSGPNIKTERHGLI